MINKKMVSILREPRIEENFVPHPVHAIVLRPLKKKLIANIKKVELNKKLQAINTLEYFFQSITQIRFIQVVL